MSDQKRYTAQEMREMAESAVSEVEYRDDGCTAIYEHMYGIGKKFRPYEVREMLRQAADMRERAERRLGETRRHMEECLNCGLSLQAKVDRLKLDDINYILHGDAGKEER